MSRSHGRGSRGGRGHSAGRYEPETFDVLELEAQMKADLESAPERAEQTWVDRIRERRALLRGSRGTERSRLIRELHAIDSVYAAFVRRHGFYQAGSEPDQSEAAWTSLRSERRVWMRETVSTIIDALGEDGYRTLVQLGRHQLRTVRGYERRRRIREALRAVDAAWVDHMDHGVQAGQCGEPPNPKAA